MSAASVTEAPAGTPARTFPTLEAAARAYAAKVGITGRKGGWLYRHTGRYTAAWDGTPQEELATVTQGWASFAGDLARAGVITTATGDKALRWVTSTTGGGYYAPAPAPYVLTDRLQDADARRAARALRDLFGPSLRTALVQS